MYLSIACARLEEQESHNNRGISEADSYGPALLVSRATRGISLRLLRVWNKSHKYVSSSHVSVSVTIQDGRYEKEVYIQSINREVSPEWLKIRPYTTVDVICPSFCNSGRSMDDDWNEPLTLWLSKNSIIVAIE